MQAIHYYTGLSDTKVLESRKWAWQKHFNHAGKKSIINRSLILFFLSVIFCANAFAQTYFEQAQKAHYEQDYATAIKYLNSDLQLNPKHSDAYMLRASCYYYSEYYNDALSDINEAIKYYNKKTSIYAESQLYSERGDIYYVFENYKEAIANYSTAIKKDAKKVDYLRRRAECYAAIEEYDKSDADYNKALQIDNTYTAARFGLINNMIAIKKYDEAMNSLDQLEKFDPRNALLFYKRGFLYGRIYNNYKKAIDDIITYMYYDEVDYSGSRWLLYYSQFNVDYTVAKIKSKILVDIGQKLLWSDLLARVYSSNNRYLDAIDVYNDMAKENDDNIGILYYRGLLYDKIGFYDKAISDFNAGIKLDPDDEDFYLSRAASFNAQEKFDDAINDINKAIQLKPMNISGYSAKARSKWMYKKDYQGAIEDISMAITIDDENTHAYLVRARLYQQLNKQNLAQADLNKIIELNDSSSTLAYALILQNKLQEANTLIDTLIKNDSTDYYDYACMYSLMNAKAKAIDYLHKALENGWRDFVHLENDPDVDNIRNTQEYKSLLADYKSKYKKEMSDYESVNISNPTAKNAGKQVYAIPIKKLKSNLYEVICSVNGVPMKFIYDTGASGVLLSRTEADFLLKNDYLKSSDFGGKVRSKIANGSIVEGISLKIRKFKIGDFELDNIEGTIIDNADVDLLLGQSVLQKFGKIEIDNEKSIMIIVVNK